MPIKILCPYKMYIMITVSQSEGLLAFEHCPICWLLINFSIVGHYVTKIKQLETNVNVPHITKRKWNYKSTKHLSISGALEFTHVFWRGLCCSIFSCMCTGLQIYDYSFVHFSFGHCVVLLRFTDYDYPFSVFKLFVCSI